MTEAQAIKEKKEAMKDHLGLKRFGEYEIIWYARFNKKEQIWSVNPYPLIGGRVRLAHEDAEVHEAPISMITEMQSEDETYITHRATVESWRGKFSFSNTGKKLDKYGAFRGEAIETMALARALRFAGYGIEFTGAEEMINYGSQMSDDSEDTRGSQPSGRGKNNGNGKKDSDDIKAYKRIVFNLMKQMDMSPNQLRLKAFSEFGEGQEKDWDLSKLESKHWAAIVEHIKEISIPTTTQAHIDWLRWIYPSQILVKVLKITDLPEDELLKKLEAGDLFKIITNAKQQCKVTDYQHDSLMVYVKASWGEKMDEYEHWLDVKLGKDKIDNYKEAEKIINIFAASIPSDKTLDLPDKDIYDLAGKRQSEV